VVSLWSRKVKLSVCLKHHAMRTIWNGGLAPRILNHGTRWRWVVSFTLRLLYPQSWSGRGISVGFSYILTKDSTMSRPVLKLARESEAINNTTHRNTWSLYMPAKYCMGGDNMMMSKGCSTAGRTEHITWIQQWGKLSHVTKHLCGCSQNTATTHADTDCTGLNVDSPRRKRSEPNASRGPHAVS
jgi:hypothetical protein